jgi:hypothetical protein
MGEKRQASLSAASERGMYYQSYPNGQPQLIVAQDQGSAQHLLLKQDADQQDRAGASVSYRGCHQERIIINPYKEIHYGERLGGNRHTIYERYKFHSESEANWFDHGSGRVGPGQSKETRI